MPRFLFLLAWLKLIWILFLLPLDGDILRQFPFALATYSAAYRTNLLALDFSPNDPIGSRRNWQNTRPFWKIEYKYQTHSHFYSFAACRQLPSSPRRNSLPPSSHQYSGKTQRLFINNQKIFKDFFACKIVLAENHLHPKIIKDFFACKIVLAANHQHPKIFKDFFACKIVLAANHQLPKKFKHFFDCRVVLAANHQYPGSIQRPSEQQQTAAAASGSNQQHQPAAAISSSYQQQQPAKATSSDNQQQQSAFILPAAPTQSTPTSVSYHYGS